jgi:hypothetical protein
MGRIKTSSRLEERKFAMKKRSILAFSIALALSCTLRAGAQSTDVKNPTPLTASEIAGGEIEERASYYFTFEGGPGEVTAAMEAKIKKGAKTGSIAVEIFDANAKSIASTVLSGGIDAGKEKLENELFKQLGKLSSASDALGAGDTKQRTARVKVKQKQALVLKLTVDKGIESFTLRVGGAVEFADVASTDTAAPPSQAASDMSSSSTEQSMPSEQPAQETTPGEQTALPPDPNTSNAPTTLGGEVKPTSGKPAIKLAGRPALIKVPAKQPQPASSPSVQKPALIKVPGKGAGGQQQPQTVAKPAAIKIPSKKQP